MGLVKVKRINKYSVLLIHKMVFSISTSHTMVHTKTENVKWNLLEHFINFAHSANS